MKNEKHVAIAAQIVKTINPSVGVYEFNMDDLKEAIVSALSQVERDALASKAQGAREERKRVKESWPTGRELTQRAHWPSLTLACWIKNQLKIAPHSPTSYFYEERDKPEYNHELLDGNYPKYVKEFEEWENSQLTLAPSEQVIRVPSDDSIRKMAKEIAAPYEASYEKGAAREALFYMRNAIKRLNPQARIEESDE